MNITHTLTYPAPLPELIDILTNPDFITHRLTPLNLTPTINTTTQTHAHTIHTTLTIPATSLPETIRNFVPATINATLTETYTQTSPNQWEIHTTLHLDNLPITAEAHSTLQSENTNTHRHINAEITVKIPFFGRKIENTIAQHIHKAAAAEIESVRQWRER